MKRAKQFVKQANASATNNAYQDMMGAPQDVAQHPTRNMPAPAGGNYLGVTAPFQSIQQPFADKTDPFNIGA